MSQSKNPFRKRTKRNQVILTSVLGGLLFWPTLTPVLGQETAPFQVVEATIEDIQNAIKTDQITCQGLVQLYINRAKAYNGVCTSLVTEDGASIPPATGRVFAGSPVVYPTATVSIDDLVPDFEDYVGLPAEFGRMRTTISDPTVVQQFGMRVGIPDADGVAGLETLNIRGERSVTCKAECDAAPGLGNKKLPKTCPAVCNDFSQQPDALERAAELDAEFGSDPDLVSLPMYCIPIGFKDVVDTKDMRTTANADVNYAMDAPPFDSTVVDQLRDKGAIIYAKVSAHSWNAGPGNPSGPAVLEERNFSGVRAISGWSGQACNPYDTEREPRGSSSGAGVSVATNLLVCAFCEQTAGSCKGPASRNGVVNLVTTHGIMPDEGGFPNQFITDRLGITCRTVGDTALVLDALKDPKTGYFDPDTYYTAIPKGLISEEPYASFVVDDVEDKPLEGIRIGIVREFMVKHSDNDVAISDQINEEFIKVLRDELGAELVESFDVDFKDDKKIPNMEYTFQDGFAEIFPRNIPEYFLQTDNGEPEFAVPGFDVTSYDYMLALGRGEAPLSDDLNLRRIASGFPNALIVKYGVEQYLLDRGDERVTDWESLFANTLWRDDANRQNGENWLSSDTVVSDGKSERILMRFAAELVLLNVMRENNIDVFVAPENTLPQRLIGGPSEPNVKGRGGSGATQTHTALLGIPEIVVPAGFNQIVFEPEFALNAVKTRYISISGTEESLLPNPLPISIMFWAGPGDEPTLIMVASAYEAATQHRIPPPDFPPLVGEP